MGLKYATGGNDQWGTKTYDATADGGRIRPDSLAGTDLDPDRWAGPACGVDGCAREVGHTGDHRQDPSDPRSPFADIEAENARLRAVVHAARDVDGLWFPQDDNMDGSDLTFWGPEAGEALRDLRDAIEALDRADASALTGATADPTADPEPS